MQIPLKASELAYWEEEKDGLVVGKGKLRLAIGPSSEDIRLTRETDVVE